jgi:DNA (cytosine-5)-methyltransferase 1
MKNKFQNIQNTKANIDDSGRHWESLELSTPKRPLRLGTSFSGIGAIEQALKRLNVDFEIMFAGDIDSNCKSAYFANYDITEDRWHSDIHDFNATPYLGKIDLFVGGAPCQAFSLRGKHGGFEDTRGTLFREFARVVKECQPKVFIFENVKGMLSHDKGNTWEVIKNTFEEYCDYQVYFQLLNSKDYGVPQSRDRIYCIGFKKETDFKYPAPVKLEKSVYDYLQDVIPDRYFLKEKGIQFITKSINHNKSYTQINGDVQLCQKRNQQFNWHGDFVFHPFTSEKGQPSDFMDLLYRVNDTEESYYTQGNLMKRTIYPDGLGNHIMRREAVTQFDPQRGWYRKLTPRECLRLMGFDDSFKQVVSDTESYRQSGNSIVVDVLIALLKQLDITKYCIYD